MRPNLLASWLTTVFCQLECEAYGNNRKGLRKLDQRDYEPLHIPVTENFTDEQIERMSQLQLPNLSISVRQK